MKQFTTPEQTAKLIELGFEKPKGWCAEGVSSRTQIYKRKEDDEGFNYSIGELIEMLPIYCWYRYGDRVFMALFQIKFYLCRWHIVYRKLGENHCGHLYDCGSDELIDALYDMIVKLKGEGVI